MQYRKKAVELRGTYVNCAYKIKVCSMVYTARYVRQIKEQALQINVNHDPESCVNTRKVK